MSRNTMIVILACLATVIIVAFVLTTRSSAPVVATSAPAASTPAATAVPVPSVTPAAPVTADAAILAKDSTDPGIASFISSLRSSSVSSCNATLKTSLQTSDPTVLAKLDNVCSCASDRVVATITVDEARAAMLSVLNHDTATNNVIGTMKTRFADAGKICMAAATKN